ncbi:MAG TPA: undecaprenyl-diphosphatase UppP [Anaerolineae bacterium]|nr:undecaprenyl-diphosphatase UppP [Anaerolineae bacterium]
MEMLRAILLGFIQGVTEFVPVSSSGHLVLVPWLLGWESPGLLFDTVVHWGTLIAVVAYFWRDWLRLATAWVRGLIRWDWRDADARLMWLLILGSVPAAVLGYLFDDFFEALFSEPLWASIFLLVTAVILILSERLGSRHRSLKEMRWVDAVVIGLAQTAAIAPGISRSGATIGAGQLLGLRREDAARFSFMLSTPVILGAGVFQLANAVQEKSITAGLPGLVAGSLVAGVAGYLSVRFMLRYLQGGRLYLFALYCIWVGTSCLVVALLR